MRMNHINLTVPDTQETRTFLETYFGLKCLVADNEAPVTVLMDDAHNVITLNSFGKPTEVVYPKGFHIGFFQPSREHVDAIHKRLAADGYAPKTPKEFHGAWTFYFTAPGGFMVEVGHQQGAPAELVA